MDNVLLIAILIAITVYQINIIVILNVIYAHQIAFHVLSMYVTNVK